MEGCLFCKIAKGESPSYKVYEDENFLAFLDIFPINEGHVLLIPKKHFERFAETDDEVLSKIIVVIKKVAKAVKKATGAEGYNIGINNEKAAGEIVPHTHFHIIPRFDSDGLSDWHGKKANTDQLKRMCEDIKKAF